MKRKKKAKTIWSIVALIVTLALAVSLPQLIFILQDYRQMNTIAFDDRESFEVLTTEATYSRDMNTRMATLANVGYGNVNISKLARSIDITEFNELITNVKNQGYMIYLEEMLPTVYENIDTNLNATQIETCDCYIVYGSDYTNGVILMFWYMVFDIPELNGKLELIVDSETESIYYVQLESDKVAEGFEETQLVVMSGKDFYALETQFGASAKEIMPAITEEIEAVTTNFPSYFSNYYCRYYGIPYISTVENSEVNFAYSGAYLWNNIAIGENEYTMAYALPYNGYEFGDSIFFRFHVKVDEPGGTNLSIGIPIIRRFVQS